MKYDVTTKADIEMGNGIVTIEAATPAEAATKYGPLLAADYFNDDADDHVGEHAVIMVQDAACGQIHEYAIEYV